LHNQIHQASSSTLTSRISPTKASDRIKHRIVQRVRERGVAHERVGGDVVEVAAAEATVAARGCHGTTCAVPRQLEG
jgi:hypothetical protein